MQLGQKVCTVGRDGSKSANVGKMSFPVWTGKIYEIRSTQDGRLFFRLVGSYGPSSSGKKPSVKLVAELRELAEFPFVEGVSERAKVSSVLQGV